MLDTGEEREAAAPARSDATREPARSLVSRPLAAIVLIVILAASALSAWLVVTADFENARPRAPQPASATRR